MREVRWNLVLVVIGVAAIGVAGNGNTNAVDELRTVATARTRAINPEQTPLTGLDRQRAVWSRTFGGTNADYLNSVQQTTDGGYIAAGQEESWGMGSLLNGWVIKLDASGNKVWSTTLGGVDGDGFRSVDQTTDGGYILAGFENTWGMGQGDAWVVRLDNNGTKVWSDNFGGTDNESFQSVRQTTDGGYILAGYESSWGSGLTDGWVVKLDSSGSKIWSRTFGGTGNDVFYCVRQTGDGGYIVAGCESSWGMGGDDAWIMKLDGSGTKVWSRTFGGTQYELFQSVQQTADGGYIVVGRTSWGNGNGDGWVMKLDANGNQVWSNVFGSTEYDELNSVQQTTDGGFIVAGYESGWGSGYGDGWVLKLDGSGNKVWSSILGGAEADLFASVHETSDAGYIIAGYQNSSGQGSYDGWVVKLDSSGSR